MHSLPWTTACCLLFLAGCGGLVTDPVRSPGATGEAGDSLFLVPQTDAQLQWLLANRPTPDDPPEHRDYYEFYVNQVLTPTGHARYQALALAPCTISIDNQVRLLKSNELTGDEELDRIFLTSYCASSARSTRFMQDARIRLRQQYPALSQDKIDLLAEQELEAAKAQWVRDAREEFRNVLEPSPRLSCTSQQLGATTLTDCY